MEGTCQVDAREGINESSLRTVHFLNSSLACYSYGNEAPTPFIV